MKRAYPLKTLLMLLLFVTAAQHSFGQKGEWKLGADLVSRYIWRGTDYGNAPGIQPAASYNYGWLSVGAWGSYALNTNYQETDLYVTYNVQNVLSFTVTDYFFPSGIVGTNSYFKYGKDETGHIFEGTLAFSGVARFPVSFAVNYNFFGADKNKSVYLEMGYGREVKHVQCNVFVGATTGKGIYLPDGSDSFSVVNVGLKLAKSIPVSETFALPVQVSVITNPQAQNLFFVFGLTL